MAHYANRSVPDGHGTTSYFGAIPKPTKEITVDMLDYAYIETCEDASELRGILEVLQSGKEGYYPALMQAAETKMLSLIPERERNKILRLKLKPSDDDVNVAKADLASWEDSISKMDKRIQSKKSASVDSAKQSKSRKLPPVRGEKPTNSISDGTPKQSKPSPSAKEVATESKSRKISTLAPVDKLVGNDKEDPNPAQKGLGFSESIGGYDFRAWERYDVDKVLEEMDKDDEISEEEKKRRLGKAKDVQKQREAHRKMRLARDRENLSSDFLEALDAMSQEEREFMATRERQKGNECFKAGELDEAIVNYTRSAALNPNNAPVHANRALAYLRMKMFERAEDDCTHALEVDPKYVKAWSRRGMVRHRRGKYAEAMTDFEMALKLEPSNAEVSKLLSKSKAKFEELEGVDSRAGTSFTRVLIEEVDSEGDDEQNESDSKETEQSSGDGFRKIQIVEDDDSDESDDENDSPPSQFTKVPIECDDDDDDEDDDNGGNQYVSVAIVDVEGDDEEDDDDEPVESKFIKVDIVCDDDESNDEDEKSGSDTQFVKVPIECEDDDDGDDDDNAAQDKPFVKVPIEYDDDDDDEQDESAQEKPSNENNFVKIQIQCDDDEDDDDDIFGDDDEDDDDDIFDDDGDVNEPSVPTPQECKAEGTKFFAQGNYQSAFDQFSKAIDILQKENQELSKDQLNDLVSCSNNRAACALKLENYEDAKCDCDLVLKYNPSNHKALLRRGTTFEKLGKLQSALHDFQSALAISPNLVDATIAVQRISAKIEAESTTVTAEASAEAIKFKDMGNQSFKQKKLEAALEQYSQSISLDPCLFVSYCNRALIYIKLGRFKEAIADCDKTLQLNSGNEKAMYRRGLALFEMNEYKSALEMFENLVEINPSNQQAVAQVKKVQGVLSKMPAPKVSVLKDEKAASGMASTAPSNNAADNKADTARNASTTSPKASSSPLKAVDTTQVAEVARERIKTKLTKGKKRAAPKTAYEFENYWRTLKNDEKAFYKYFKLLKPRQIPKLFKGSINEDVLSTILVVIEKYMISEDCTRAFETMLQITKINRISTVLMLMGKEDKAKVSTICNRLNVEDKDLDKSALRSIAKVFEVELG